MNIEKYMVSNELSPADVVDLLKLDCPKFNKRQVSMCKNGEYGVTLSPTAVQILNKAHPPKKENRVRTNKVTVHLHDLVYAALLEFCEENCATKQDVIEMAIYTFLKPIFGRSAFSRVKLEATKENTDE